MVNGIAPDLQFPGFIHMDILRSQHRSPFWYFFSSELSCQLFDLFEKKIRLHYYWFYGFLSRLHAIWHLVSASSTASVILKKSSTPSRYWQLLVWRSVFRFSTM